MNDRSNSKAPVGAISRSRSGDRSYIVICLAAACALAAAAQPLTAQARAYHSQSLDGLIARCSTVNTSTLPEASLNRYDVESDDDTGLLSCVVQKQKAGLEPNNTQAQVQAEYHAIGMTPESIELREVRENNLVTYLGTYDVTGTHPLQFSVRLTAEGETVEMNFDDQSPQL